MNNNVFDIIDCKIVEIMNIIEHQKNFTMLANHIEEFTNESEENKKLFHIYSEISKLRSI